MACVSARLLPLYALFLLQTLVWTALVPLAPTFARDLHLSKVETGALLASGGFMTILVAVPIGLLADRVGARALTAASAVLFAASSLGQGLAGDFWSFLLARAAFGASVGALWTAGLAFLADSAERPPARRMGATVATSGLGFAAGPAFAGLVADSLGTGAPFLVAAGLGALVSLAMVALPQHGAQRLDRPALASLRAAGGDSLVLASLVVMLLLGLVAGGVNLLVPLRLRQAGVSAGEIGLLFSGASLLYALVSGGVARMGSRAVTVRVAGAAVLAYGLSFLVVIGSEAALAAVAFLFVRAPFWATLDTIVYSLGATGAHRAALGRGAVMGILNVLWGIAATGGPLLAGSVAQAGGDRAAYALLAAVCLAAAAWMAGRESSQAPQIPARRRLPEEEQARAPW